VIHPSDAKALCAAAIRSTIRTEQGGRHRHCSPGASGNRAATLPRTAAQPFIKTRHGACRCIRDFGYRGFRVSPEGSQINTLGNACWPLPSNRPHIPNRRGSVRRLLKSARLSRRPTIAPANPGQLHLADSFIRRSGCDSRRRYQDRCSASEAWCPGARRIPFQTRARLGVVAQKARLATRLGRIYRSLASWQPLRRNPVPFSLVPVVVSLRAAPLA